MRSQVYDEQITQFIQSVGIENIARSVVNTLKVPAFAKPNFQLEHLIAVGKTLVQEQDRVRTMGLVSEYNQALTPSRLSQTRRRESALLTPPENNPLQPYSVSPSAAEKTAKHSASETPFKSSAQAQSNGAAANSLPSDIQRQLSAILAQGHRLGIEHVDKRRFRVNSWRSHDTFDSSNEVAAANSLKDCLRQFPDHYIRLISIDPQTKRRVTETIIHRPQ